MAIGRGASRRRRHVVVGGLTALAAVVAAPGASGTAHALPLPTLAGTLRPDGVPVTTSDLRSVAGPRPGAVAEEAPPAPTPTRSPTVPVALFTASTAPVPVVFSDLRSVRAAARAVEQAQTGPPSDLTPGLATGPGEDRAVDCRVTKCVALTFDDGPGPYTDRLLRALRARDARSTFFVLGDVSVAQPDALRRIDEADHEIATHTWSHRELPALTSAGVRAQLDRSADAVERITGTRPDLMRPPYGSLSPRILRILDAQSWPVVLWSVDPQDWKDRNADTVYRRVVRGTRPGSIVLLHDIHASTVAAVPRILAELDRRGYTFVTVSELYGRELTDGRVYRDRADAYAGPPARSTAPTSTAAPTPDPSTPAPTIPAPTPAPTDAATPTATPTATTATATPAATDAATPAATAPAATAATGTPAPTDAPAPTP